MSIKYLAHICTGTGNCHADPKHSVIINARGYDDAMEKFANTVNKEDEIHIFIYDMEAKQVLSSGFFGKASHWQSVKRLTKRAADSLKAGGKSAKRKVVKSKVIRPAKSG